MFGLARRGRALKFRAVRQLGRQRNPRILVLLYLRPKYRYQVFRELESLSQIHKLRLEEVTASGPGDPAELTTMKSSSHHGGYDSVASLFFDGDGGSNAAME